MDSLMEMCLPPAKSKAHTYGAGLTTLLKQNHLDNLADKFQGSITITQKIYRYKTYQ